MTGSLAWVMAFADSEVREVQHHGAEVHLLFSAASATQQSPSGERTEGYLQGVCLVVQQCAPASTLDHVFGRLRSGRVRLDRGDSMQTLVLPGRWSGPLSLELEPTQGDVVLVAAQGLECRLAPGGSFRESLFC